MEVYILIKGARTMPETRGRKPSIFVWMADGKHYTLQEISTYTGIPLNTIRKRWEVGDRSWHLDRPCKSPVPSTRNGQRGRPTKVYTPVHDELLSLRDIATMYNIPIEVVRLRYHTGKRDEELVAPYKPRRNRLNTTP